MGSCEVGDGSTRSVGAGLRVACVGSLINTGGFVAEPTRLSPVLDGIVAGADGAVDLESRPVGRPSSVGRILRDLAIVGLATLGTTAVFRAPFCAGGAGFPSAFVLTCFFTRPVRFPAMHNRR